MIYTQRKRPKKESFLEDNFEPSITEQGGYVPPHIQIENFMIQGRKLLAYREQFDFSEEDHVDEYFNDPTRRWNYDMAEASQESFVLEERLKEQKRVDEEQKKLEEDLKNDSKNNSDSNPDSKPNSKIKAKETKKDES